jgi:ADP-ribose pyrophosphatase YjhB (NUDIX family)
MDVGAEHVQTWIEQDQWELIQRRVPIACVDFIPVLRTPSGAVSHVGLILRQSPFSSDKWSHMGGRINRMETVREALQRHLREALEESTFALPLTDDTQPGYVMQWFPDERADFGHDPRQHAVALGYVLECSDPSTKVRPGGEAKEFRWVPIEEIEKLPNLWPGTARFVAKLVGVQREMSALAISYQALALRANTHNNLMWQTPGLAMAAQAFLLTIALAPGMSLFGRVASCLANILISLLCIQLLGKHSKMELSDRRLMERIDTEYSLIPINARTDQRNWRPYVRLRSRVLWQLGFGILVAISVVTLGLALAMPSILSASIGQQ